MIDHLMALDPGGRGIGAFFVAGGATAAAQALRKSRRVLLTTGFSVGPGMPEPGDATAEIDVYQSCDLARKP